MPIIGPMDAKAPKGRTVVAAIYLFLVVGGLAMVCPFLVMLTGSFSSPFDFERRSLAPRFLWSTEDRFMRLLATLFPPAGRPAAECILAFTADHTPAGFALYFTNYSTFLAKPGLYLEDLFVLLEYRGRGLGKSLLLHLAKLANQRGYGRMEWAVLDWNQPAIDFYESLGAERKTDWTTCRLTGPALARYA